MKLKAISSFDICGIVLQLEIRNYSTIVVKANTFLCLLPEEWSTNFAKKFLSKINKACSLQLHNQAQYHFL